MPDFSAKINITFDSNLDKVTKKISASTKKMSKSFKKTEEKIKGVTNKLKKMGNVIKGKVSKSFKVLGGKLKKIGGGFKELGGSLKIGISKLKGFAGGFGKLGSLATLGPLALVAAAVAAITAGIVVSAKKFTDFSKSVFRNSLNLDKQASSLSLSVVELQKLQRTFKTLGDLDTDETFDVLNNLKDSIGDVVAAGEKSPKWEFFDALDIKVEDVNGKVKSVTDVLTEISEVYDDMEPGQKQLFGTLMEELSQADKKILTVVTKGAKNIKKTFEGIDETKLFEEKDINAAKKLQNSIGAVAARMATLGKSLTPMFESIANAIEKLADNEGIWDGMKSVIEAAASLVQRILDDPERLTKVFESIATALNVAADALEKAQAFIPKTKEEKKFAEKTYSMADFFINPMNPNKVANIVRAFTNEKETNGSDGANGKDGKVEVNGTDGKIEVNDAESPKQTGLLQDVVDLLTDQNNKTTTFRPPAGGALRYGGY